MNNISFTFTPKGKNPETNEWDYRYLVPAVKDQQGEANFIIVCCHPTLNGVYRWEKKEGKKYKVWDNHGKACYYIPRDDCEYRSFDELDMTKPINQKLIEKVKQIQNKWYKGETKGHGAYKRQKPDWMLK